MRLKYFIFELRTNFVCMRLNQFSVCMHEVEPIISGTELIICQGVQRIASMNFKLSAQESAHPIFTKYCECPELHSSLFLVAQKNKKKTFHREVHTPPSRMFRRLFPRSSYIVVWGYM